MSKISWPAGLIAREFDLPLRPNLRGHASPLSLTEQVVDLLADRWEASFVLPVSSHANAARVEAFLAALRASGNTVDIWHMGRGRNVPRGTMRGTPTLAESAAVNANSISIQTSAGATLLAGDLVGVGGLLLMAAADATANGSGVMSLSLVNRLRAALSSAAAVTWDTPKVEMRLTQASPVHYVPGMVNEVTVSLIEHITD